MFPAAPVNVSVYVPSAGVQFPPDPLLEPLLDPLLEPLLEPLLDPLLEPPLASVPASVAALGAEDEEQATAPTTRVHQARAATDIPAN